MLTYFILSTTILFLSAGLIWCKKDGFSLTIKVWLIVHAFLGAYIIFHNNLLG